MASLLVTGGSGFVMSVVGRTWLERDPTARLIILDRADLDTAARRYFAPVSDRVTVIVADLLDIATWGPQVSKHPVSAVVHGATITPISRGSAAEARREPESENPARIIDVNLMGTVKVLEWARQQSGLGRFVYVSSGSVYRNHGPDWRGEPLPEDGYVAPLKLYGISKLASELIVNRYRDLFGLAALSVRLASVYGPMDRTTESRSFRHVPNRIAHMALAGETVRPTNLDAIGDYISSQDVAHAILALVDAPHLKYRTYNIGSGTSTSIGDFLKYAAERAPQLTWEISPIETCNIDQDSALSTGMWGVYDIARILRDTGWHPHPVRERFHEYMDWIKANG
jgi:UDP-glucose 4-epimerase